MLFTARSGGVSEGPYASLNLATHVGDDPVTVDRNRDRLAERIGLPAHRVVYMQQVHGTTVAVVDEPAEEPPVADALVTTSRDLALVVLVADCVPVLIVDDDAGIVAAVHAGRRGLADGVVTTTLDVMAGLGSHDVRAEVGPAICGACYEVPSELRDEVVDRVPESWSTTRQGTSALDVPAGVEAQLRAAGVGRISRSGICTLEDDDYFSYRGASTTGRFAGVVWRS